MDSGLLLIGGAVGVIVGVLGIVVGQVWRTYWVTKQDAHRVGEGEAIFPLAYTLVEGTRPSARYRQRLDIARAIWARWRIPIWCLGGTLATMERSTAYHTKRYLIERGVAADTVRTLDEFPFLGQSVETIEEVLVACTLARQMKVRRFIVISDLLHLAQIRLVLSALDVDPIFVTTPLTPSWTAVEIRYLLIRLVMIVWTLADRRGRTLGWLRAWRSGVFRGRSRPSEELLR